MRGRERGAERDRGGGGAWRGQEGRNKAETKAKSGMRREELDTAEPLAEGEVEDRRQGRKGRGGGREAGVGITVGA